MDKTTYKKIAKDNPKDLVEVIIGDALQPDFKPQIKLERWQNECNVSIRLKETPEELLETPTITEKNGKIEYKKSKREAHFYDIAPNEEHPEGAFETEIILLEKPDTNVVEFTVVDKDVDYFYQTPLTQTEIDEGTSRPENVEGSYAVYAKTPKTNYTGGKEYKVGKIGHIYRPKIIDSVGTEVWGTLLIENGILSVTIPQEFLDIAVYPVRHAAGLTFGYTGIGATGYTNGNPWASRYLATAGDIESISAYSGTSGYSVRAAIYDGGGGTAPVNLLVESADGTSLLNGWVTMSASVTLSATSYWLGYKRMSAGSYKHNADATGGTSYYGGSPAPLNNTSNYPATWGTGGTTGTRKLSIYATYTAAVGANTTNFFQFL